MTSTVGVGRIRPKSGRGGGQNPGRNRPHKAPTLGEDRDPDPPETNESRSPAISEHCGANPGRICGPRPSLLPRFPHTPARASLETPRSWPLASTRPFRRQIIVGRPIAQRFVDDVSFSAARRPMATSARRCRRLADASSRGVWESSTICLR